MNTIKNKTIPLKNYLGPVDRLATMSYFVDDKKKAPKISELIATHVGSSYGSKPFVSIEFYPPRTEAGVENLYLVLEKLTLAPHPDDSAIPM